MLAPRHDYSDYIMEELGIDLKSSKTAAKDKAGKEDEVDQEEKAAPVTPAKSGKSKSSPKQKSTTSKLK